MSTAICSSWPTGLGRLDLPQNVHISRLKAHFLISPFFLAFGCQRVGMPGLGSTLSPKCQNGEVVSRPLPTKLLYTASLSRHLDYNQKGECVCEERTLGRSQTGQAQLGFNFKASKCSDAGTGDLGVLPPQEHQ